MVALTGRPWRSFAAPLAFLLAATLVVALVRAGLNDDQPAAGKVKPATAAKPKPAATSPTKGVYVVRAGDTLATIAAATGVSVARLLALNPRVEPTSLFIGDEIHLR